MKSLVKLAAAFLLLAAGVLCFLILWPLRDKHPALRLPHGVLAIRDATIYLSPDKPPLANATLVVRDGRIVAVGPQAPVPADAQLLPCSGCAITAGFWNTHVHFTQPKWANAAWQSGRKLEAQLADMLTSRGFTTVVDLGSDPRDTVSLRRRVETGEVNGPFIYLSGADLYPEDGIPFYVRESTPKFMQNLTPQPSTPADAARDEERDIAIGADVLKLFTGSYVARGRIKPMREDIARAAVEGAHRHGHIAFAHPSSLEGVKVALASGVDVLAHTPDTTAGIDDAFISEMARKETMVPTLKMFATTVTTESSYLDPIYSIVRRFHQNGGNLMFGTDVGYMTDYSTADEFAALSKCGLTPMEILRMLTVAPAARLGELKDKGTLEPGKLADFVVLGADPAVDANAFASVQATVRSGKLIWRNSPPAR